MPLLGVKVWDMCCTCAVGIQALRVGYGKMLCASLLAVMMVMGPAPGAKPNGLQKIHTSWRLFQPVNLGPRGGEFKALMPKQAIMRGAKRFVFYVCFVLLPVVYATNKGRKLRFFIWLVFSVYCMGHPFSLLLSCDSCGFVRFTRVHADLHVLRVLHTFLFFVFCACIVITAVAAWENKNRITCVWV